ncbi:hypothetical protein CABS01_14495 [Colletotrichum abscissum]|uniref:uncharacterized protein n=1 Tax=Colletotrichum abscissum TaxID=1671311 RepID=UPI0027D6DB78|nr:uncharacterized protein CABS01_14495 [Colletotrichum abscissum]KAK1480357.1 hypothetical protein CABS01_14495 [Colletotrichum abscissum]
MLAFGLQKPFGTTEETVADVAIMAAVSVAPLNQDSEDDDDWATDDLDPLPPKADPRDGNGIHQLIGGRKASKATFAMARHITAIVLPVSLRPVIPGTSEFRNNTTGEWLHGPSYSLITADLTLRRS